MKTPGLGRVRYGEGGEGGGKGGPLQHVRGVQVLCRLGKDQAGETGSPARLVLVPNHPHSVRPRSVVAVFFLLRLHFQSGAAHLCSELAFLLLRQIQMFL